MPITKNNPFINPRLFTSEYMERCTLNQCRAACCLHGVWVDILEMQDILNHKELIFPEMPEWWRDPMLWFDEAIEEDGDSTSGLVGHSFVTSDPLHYGRTACVFLREDYKCALQVAGEKNGFHPWRFKPYYCILHPLDLDETGRITLDESSLLIEEEASCLRPSERKNLLLHVFEPELKYLLGEKRYESLLTRNEALLPEPDSPPD